ncbi:TonB-dependent receptor [Chryseobacterium contaminans]|uniref:Iron complex outermembrane recepter protein n=1 Tax=Chryseobacterium contaminans TaxID=1423959 RepID=A0A1M7EM81_9FLAO|nr:TonB-dependent receptor [Chryseobacterium contaminans]OCA77918.1 TonB-dependent receptor [Chryseobacterium contaminans]SHL92778.1 iron complex outermembrane recepter protein [Chryseobacterium contaminans]
MNIKRSLVLFLSSYGCFLFGQEKAVDTIYIFDSQMNKVKQFHPVQTIHTEDAEKNSNNLSELLRFQSSIYIKENGRGAVSSPSFRGTTAQQTAFVWNGININSNFLGQGDVNNIALFGYDQIGIKAGGGSVTYGSGAIGGSIHMDNSLSFNKGFHGTLFSEAGSFNTYNNFVKGSYSNDKFSFKVSGNYSVSENEYEVNKNPKNYINRNGEYYNTNFNVAAAYKLAPNHQVSWISEWFNGQQHFPILFESETKTKYQTQNVRSLISWDWNTTKFNNSFKAAYTEENFEYFNDIDRPKFSGGTGKNYILKNDFNYFLNSKWNFNIIGEYQHNKGEGYGSGIDKVHRNMGSVVGLVRYFPTSDLRLEAGIRQDYVGVTKSPLLFSFSGKWNALHWYNLGLSISRNFRAPSFNDLYWRPGGNENLKPETSYQFEVRNQFKTGDFKLSLVPYYMDIRDMIRWLQTPFGYPSPVNTDHVRSYGVETQAEFTKRFGKHFLNVGLGYTYTNSQDLEKKKQLMYVPFHKFNGNIGYQYEFIKVYAQGLFTGLTYTDSNEKESEALKEYFVMNAGVGATFLKNYTLGFKINNIFNQTYYTMFAYPLPGRNYSVNLNINF